MKVLITTGLNKKICRVSDSFRLLSFKKLSKKEVSLTREFGIRRFYLPTLNNEDTGKFLSEFDEFWDKIIYKFGREHPFWRNVISSKMQPWENSAGYLCLVLFTLTHISDKEKTKLLIVCDTVEMKKLFIEWAEINSCEIVGDDVHKSDWYKINLQKINNFIWFFMRFLFCLYKKWYSPGIAPRNSSDKALILISSFFYPNSFKNGSYYDPFFGTLHNFIKKNGLECVYLCEPLNEFDKAMVRKTSQCNDVTVYTTYSLIGWWSLIAVLLKLYFRKIEIPQSKFMGCDLSGFIQWHSLSFRNSFNLTAELRFASARKLFKTYKFERLIYGFEGNAHERACIQAFRRINSDKIVGYSHAVIYPLNLKIRLTSRETLLKPEPDIYVCTGPYARKLFEKVGERYPSSRLREGCIIKEVPAIKKSELISDNRKMLVALDGMDSTVVLLEWVLEHVKDLNDIRFFLRFHPNVPAKRILCQCINYLPDNVEISDKNLTQDIKSSFCVLYRHSSVGMQAILNGVPAVYLAVDSPLSGDPLEELSSYKWSISSPSELITVVEEIKSLSPEQRDDLLKSAGKFLRGYFAAPAEDSLRSFLN